MQTERRQMTRRHGPIRSGIERRTEDVASLARIQRGPERRTADRRSGTERRHSANVSSILSGAA